MPSTITKPNDRSARAARLDELGALGRRSLYEQGQLDREDLVLWASLYPDEPTLVNGEYPWIGLMLADLD